MSLHAPQPVTWLIRLLLAIFIAVAGAPATLAADHPAGEQEQPAASPSPAAEEEDGGLVVRYGQVRLSVQLFGDLNFGYSSPQPPAASSTSFAFGSIDLFTTAQVGDHFRTLMELTVEADPASSASALELDAERLWGMWAFNDAVYLKLGLEHTTITRWNRRYHHGRWFWLTVEHPFLARFEDDGGVLPVHTMGIEIGGTLNTGIGGIQYNATLSNGRPPQPGAVAKVFDTADSKAVFLGLAYFPAALPGLGFGGNVNFNHIPADPGPPARPQSLREVIGTGFVELQRGGVDVLGEIALIEHEDLATGRSFHHRMGYIQAGYRIGELTPSARFDIRLMGRGDPFYAPAGLDLDQWLQSLGLRYELNDHAVIKIEGGFGDREIGGAPGGGARERFGMLAIQLSWVL